MVAFYIIFNSIENMTFVSASFDESAVSMMNPIVLAKINR